MPGAPNIASEGSSIYRANPTRRHGFFLGSPNIPPSCLSMAMHEKLATMVAFFILHYSLFFPYLLALSNDPWAHQAGLHHPATYRETRLPLYVSP